MYAVNARYIECEQSKSYLNIFAYDANYNGAIWRKIPVRAI
jgi:hypothetical protein